MKEEIRIGERVESWKDLKVLQMAHDLVLKVYKVTKHFPVDERFRLTDQLCRARNVSMKMRHWLREFSVANSRFPWPVSVD